MRRAAPERPSTLLDLTVGLAQARRQRQATRLRLGSVFRRGWIVILVALLNGHWLPTGRFVPELWSSTDVEEIKPGVIHDIPLAA